MKFAILGAGALGTILGAHLVRAGHEVSMLARGERAKVLRRDGLRLNGLIDIAVPCTVIDNPAQLKETGTFIVATKAIDSRASLAVYQHVRADLALSVQNGVMKNDLLGEVWGESRVLGAMADFSGELLADGTTKFTRNVCLHIGELPGGTSERAGALAKIIDDAGVRCAEAPDVRTREWSKFAGWIAQFPLAVLTRQITWKFLTDERAIGVIVRIIRESAALAAAMKIELKVIPPQFPVPTIAAASDAEAVAIIRKIGETFKEKSPEHRMSAQQDVLRGSRLEFEETLGYALARGREFGVPMPTLDTCYRLVATAHG
jgi:2-dehydropantoate 2-reductase